ncbi:glycoside hydrolase family 24 protein [Achromobacter ruhlandii]|uniref:glycoside hydrolase family 24 protein n=1 Tax=Achromobacter ruhlandii TaxID=72557 RepID=UPI0007BF0A39|nr:glycoside hydrolase family 104 protein [Achromobacter ruhlandii]
MATAEELAGYLSNPNVQKVLRVIGQAEGTVGDKIADPYRIAFGGGTFDSLDNHPNTLTAFTQTDGKQNKSSAAGAYQFLKPTWDDVSSKLGLKDFSPRSQDIAALELINRAGALQDVLKGDTSAAFSKLGGTWASLPSSPYAQPKRSQGFIEQALNAVIPAAEAASVAKIDPNQVQWDDAPSQKASSGIDPASVQWDEPSAQAPYRVEMSQEDAQRMQNAAKPQERGLMERLGRQVGLTARAGVTGLTGLPQMGTNAVIGGLNSLLGTNIPKADVNATLSAIGLPEPENAVERVAQDAAGAMAGAGGVTRLAQSAVNPLANTLGQRFANVLSSSPGMQVAGGATGGASSGIAREEGAGPLGQLAAGLAGGMLGPLALYGAGATTRGLIRGGEQGRQTVANNLEAFRQAGATPTVGQATERRVLQGMESVMSQSPGGAGVMARRAANQADDLAGSVGGIVDRLSPRAGALEAGESVTSGLEGFKAGLKRVQGQLYDKLDEYIAPTSPIKVDRTKQALAALNSDIEGAPALSKMFKNSRIQGIESALGSDLNSGMTSYGAQAARKMSTLPYESIKKLRTLVGKEIDNASFVSDVPRDKWRALYSALSEDLGDAAKQAGPDAFESWRWANQFTRDQMGRLDELASVAGKDTPEKVFNAAMSGSQDGDTMLRRVVSAIPKENRKDLAAAVVQRMGRATSGNQNEVGDAFSTNTFLTNWNKLSPQARETLFGRTGDTKLVGELNNLAKVAANIRDGSKYLANPSGSGAAAARQALIGGSLVGGLTGGLPTLAAIGGGVVGSNLLSRLLTSPWAVNKLAQPTTLNVPMGVGGLQGLVPRD